MAKAALAIAVALTFVAASAAPAATRETDLSTLAARCQSRAFTVSVDPAGFVKVLEYTYPKRDKTPGAVPTGRVLASLGYAPSTRQIAPFCSRIKPAPPPSPARLHSLAGPYARGSSESRVFCMKTAAVWDHLFARSIQIEIRPLLNKARRVVGNSLILRMDSALVFTASITRRDGVYSFDYLRCMRNPPF